MAAPDGNGKRINQKQISQAGLQNSALTVTLDAGVTWASLKYVYIWCENFNALIGVVDLSTLAMGTAAPTPMMMGMPASPLYNFTNCISVSPNKMNLHWSVVGGNVEFGLETVSAPETWAAFGISDPAVPQVSMLKADVAITGVHPSFPGDGFFASEYSLTARSQCNFATSEGVCPPAKPLAGIKLVGATVNNGIRLVRFSRSITTGKYPLRLNASVPYAWAFGPLSDDRSKPVVLYHEENRAEADFKLRLSDSIQSCAPISTTSNKPVMDNSKARFVRGVKSFDITTGPNPNYPNPPGWGLSYYVNGVESPTIVVNRGDVLTFKVMASSSHPLYITSSMLGGKLSNAKSGEKVFTGDNGTAKGTKETPYVLTWTVPNDFTTAFYQCYDHQKLGWYIAEASQKEAASGAGSLSQLGALLLIALCFLCQ